jgi:hypothetical protein
LLVLYEDSGACIIELDVAYGKNKVAGVNSVRSATDILSQSPLLGGCFGGGSTTEVVFAVGSKARPTFLHVDTSSAVAVNMDVGAGGVAAGVHRQLTVGDSSSSSASSDPSEGVVRGRVGEVGVAALPPVPEMLGPHEMGGVKRPALGEAEGDGQRRKSNILWAGAGMGMGVGVGVGADERSLEVRLASLSQSLSQLERAASTPTPPTSDSLVTLVEQALQSGDDSLLETCLAAEASVVQTTAMRLSTQWVVPLLRKVVAKFEKRPSRGALLTVWVASLLRSHTSFLVTVGDLSSQLSGLGQMLELRLGTYCKLSSLAGRLDLLMAQVDYRAEGNNGSNGSGSGGSGGSGKGRQPASVALES